ncbi:MAG: pitrilysin family protein [Bacteriovoracaceae bacterium]|nr:insulinase family protein [Bacteroidota bacterium]
MKTLLLIIAALMIVSVWNGPLAAQAKILPYPINQKQLPNGLNVVTVQFDSPGLAALYIVVRVGSRNEVEQGVTGFAHFFEHMMFRGTEKYSRDKYNDVLKSIGAGANANTWFDRTIYHMTGDATKLETMFEIEADRFMNLKYTEHDFKTEAGAVKGEYTKNNASPYAQLEENLLNTAFDKHTYKHTTMGFLKDVIDMPNQYTYSLEFFNRYYRPEYSTIVVVGDANAEQVNALAEKYFGMWQHGTHLSAVPPEPPQDTVRYTHLENGSIPPYLGLNFKTPAYSDQDINVPAIDVLNAILFSETSFLYKKLVLEEQKVRNLSGDMLFTRDPYLSSIEVSLVKKEDLQYVKDEILKAIEDFKKNGTTDKNLIETKSRMKYSYAMSIDNPSTIANSLSTFITLIGDPESLNRMYALYEKVTVDDLKAAATKYYVPSGLTVATISADAQGGVK